MSFAAKHQSVVLIGSGNVAWHLGRAIARAGHPILQVVGRNKQAVTELAHRLQTVGSTQLEEMVPTAAVYIAAVKDDALPLLIPRLTAVNPHALFLHTAGSLPLDVWSQGQAARYGVLYPLQTFSKQADIDFSAVPLFVETAREEDMHRLTTFARSLSSKVFPLDSERRMKLHIAAVFANNFTNHLYHRAARLVSEADLPFEVLLPLIDETADKVHRLLPHEAQTGPAVRNDRRVIDSHLRALASQPGAQRIYELLTQDIHEQHQPRS